MVPLLIFADTFYSRLFEDTDYKKTLFKDTDMMEQGKKLVSILGVFIKSVVNMKEVEEAIADLGRKHVKFGVFEEDQYNRLGNTLLFALEKQLGRVTQTNFKEYCKALVIFVNAHRK